jgi:hypothetical protein
MIWSATDFTRGLRPSGGRRWPMACRRPAASAGTRIAMVARQISFESRLRAQGLQMPVAAT